MKARAVPMGLNIKYCNYFYRQHVPPGLAAAVEMTYTPGAIGDLVNCNQTCILKSKFWHCGY
jgi:hypothetical protein